MSEVVSCQPSVVSSEADDPLTDARCPHCGYALRGLPENRCPECGNAFDPAEVAGTFQVKWPALLKWYVLALVVAWIVSSPHLFISARQRYSMAGGPTVAICYSFANVIEALAFVLVGSVALVGLHRHRDWGRKVGVALFGTTFLLRLMPMPLSIILVNAGQLPTLVSFIPNAIGEGFWAISPLLVMIYLMSGLRSQSLSVKPEMRLRPLNRTRFEPRKDWPLLLMALLFGIAVTVTWSAINGCRMLSYVRTGRREMYHLALIAAALGTVTALWLWAAVALLWRRPTSVRSALAVALVLLMISTGCQQLFWHRFFSGLTTSVAMAGLAARLASRVLPMLALVLFAFRELTDADIRLIAARK
ncbi:MAG: hypothetical protein ACUVXJ_00540 [Phycisphaerae bacterium]